MNATPAATIAEKVATYREACNRIAVLKELDKGSEATKRAIFTWTIRLGKAEYVLAEVLTGEDVLGEPHTLLHLLRQEDMDLRCIARGEGIGEDVGPFQRSLGHIRAFIDEVLAKQC